MQSKQSYIDALNAGRERRELSAYDQLDQTLSKLEERLDSLSRRNSGHSQHGQHGAPDRQEIARRINRLNAPKSPGADDLSSRQSSEDASSNAHPAKKQDVGIEAVARVADELDKLRSEFKDEMSAGLTREFNVLRRDIEKAYVAATNGRNNEDLSAELERIADAINLLAEKHAGVSIDNIVAEIDTVKSVLGSLAREETLRAQDDRWKELSKRFERLEQRFVSLPERDSDGSEFQSLAAQLEQVSDALGKLPASLSLAPLEKRLQNLTENFDAFAGQAQSASARSFDQMAARLDEISRAIAATSASARVAKIDNEPLDRIEARMTTLSEGLKALSEGLHDPALTDQIAALSSRIDKLSSGNNGLDQIADLLNARLSAIADKIDAAPRNAELAKVIGDKIDFLTSQLDRSQSDQHQAQLLTGLEKRLDEIVARLDEPAAGQQAVDGDILRSLESQLTDISRRLTDPANSPGGTDIGPRLDSIEASLISTRENLEAQLAGLSKHLSTSAETGEMPKDLLPRLASIETSLEAAREMLGSQLEEVTRHLSAKDSENPVYQDVTKRLATIESSLERTQDTVLEIARLAAEEAVKTVPIDRQNDSVLQELTDDLKDLESITRKSEERNSRTFEAIHDTLLKIVDHISEIEGGSETPAQSGEAFTDTEDTPSLDDGYGDPLPEQAEPGETWEDRGSGFAEKGFRQDSLAGISPAEAAAAAAMAALENQRDEDSVEKSPKARKSVFSGISRAFSTQDPAADEKETASEDDYVVEEEMSAAVVPENTESEIDDAPLEPGSGAPDLSAIMSRVRDEKAAMQGSGNSATAQSDFIAAARRAAQAAAAEADLQKGKNSAGSEKSGRFSVGGLLGRNRKLMLLGVTAILVVAGGYQLGTAFLDGGTPVKNSQPSKSAAVATGDEAANAVASNSTKGSESGTLKTSQQKVNFAGSDAESKSTAAAKTIDSVPLANDRTGNQGTVGTQSPATIIALPAPELASPPQHFANQAKSEGLTAGDTAAVQSAIATTLSQTDPALPEAIGPVSLRNAAENGDPKAMFEIATRYAEGHGVDTDPATAAHWYKRAAVLGLPPAQYRYGSILEKGTGVKRDLKEAMGWYRKAADQGNASAMHNLAVLYAMGGAGPADNEAAARWFSKAADLGVTDSQFNLGIMAAKGAGMPRDLEESYKWFALAAKTGDKDAAQKRDEVAKALQPDQLKKARVAVDLWKVKPLNAEANSVQVPDAWIGDPSRTASVDMKKAIKNIQLLLASHGYDPGFADGIMGDRTKSAISAYQKDNGLPVTGEIDEKLVRKLLGKEG